MKWKPIKGYEGLYEISDIGLVRSLDRKVRYRESRTKKIKGQLLKPSLPKGYPQVSLYKNNLGNSRSVHTLVWDHFGNRPRNGHKLLVDHIDKNKANPEIANLRLLTNKQNISRQIGKGYYYNRKIKLYHAQIMINNKRLSLGCYERPIDAHNAYLKAKKKYHSI